MFGVSHAMETLREVINRNICVVLLTDHFSADWSLSEIIRAVPGKHIRE